MTEEIKTANEIDTSKTAYNILDAISEEYNIPKYRSSVEEYRLLVLNIELLKKAQELGYDLFGMSNTEKYLEGFNAVKSFIEKDDAKGLLKFVKNSTSSECLDYAAYKTLDQNYITFIEYAKSIKSKKCLKQLLHNGDITLILRSGYYALPKLPPKSKYAQDCERFVETYHKHNGPTNDEIREYVVKAGQSMCKIDEFSSPAKYLKSLIKTVPKIEVNNDFYEYLKSTGNDPMYLANVTSSTILFDADVLKGISTYYSCIDQTTGKHVEHLEVLNNTQHLPGFEVLTTLTYEDITNHTKLLNFVLRLLKTGRIVFLTEDQFVVYEKKKNTYLKKLNNLKKVAKVKKND